MDRHEFLDTQPSGEFRFYLEDLSGGYIDATPMWEFYKAERGYLPVYIQGGNVPNPNTGTMPTRQMYNSYNQMNIFTGDIERVEPVPKSTKQRYRVVAIGRYDVITDGRTAFWADSPEEARIKAEEWISKKRVRSAPLVSVSIRNADNMEIETFTYQTEAPPF